MEGMKRPKAVVLPDTALVPPENQIDPPEKLTHEVTKRQPFYFVFDKTDSEPNGEFDVGTKVLLVEDLGRICRVVDARGLYVATRCDGLKPL